jgi:predicted DNA-binding protein YlxM (UPF0122 family)
VIQPRFPFACLHYERMSHSLPRCWGFRVTEGELWLVAERVMTEAQWFAFHLHYREDFPVALIAQIEGVSRQAVGERIRKGTERLVLEKQRLERLVA